MTDKHSFLYMDGGILLHKVSYIMENWITAYTFISIYISNTVIYMNNSNRGTLSFNAYIHIHLLAS